MNFVVKHSLESVSRLDLERNSDYFKSKYNIFLKYTYIHIIQ